MTAKKEYSEDSIELLLSEQGVRSLLSASKKKYYVYIIYGGTLGTIYVGKGCKDRVFTHVRAAKAFLKENPDRPYLEWIATGEILRKPKVERLAAHLSYAPLRFSIELLTDDEDRAFRLEEKLIKELGLSRMGHGILANRVEGGYGRGPGIGRVASPECRSKISEAHTGRQVTDSHRRSLHKALVGRVLPPEVRAKMSASRLGRRATEAHKRAVALGRLNSSVIPRVKVRIGRNTYASIKEAAAAVNVHYHTFCYRLNAGTFGYKRAT